MNTAPDGRFDRYEILGHIGTGGMGEVFKARARGAHGFEKMVALKRLRPRWARDREMAARLIEEARISAKLQHANIVQVFDFGQLNDELFIVMEFVDGPSLEAILAALERRGEWISLAQTLQVVVEVARALEYAHRFSGKETAGGLVHRDVTPSNILVSRDGIVKLTDFGIAAWSELDSPAGPAGPAGKPPYMAPEQLQGDPLDGRADLFSLGVTFYRLLTRRHPWPRGIADGDRQAYEPPSHYDPALLPEIETLVTELLELDRTRRLASADLLLRELLELSYAAHIVLDPLSLRPLADLPRAEISIETRPRNVPEVLVATAATERGATILGAMERTQTSDVALRRTAAPARPRRLSARRIGAVLFALVLAAVGLFWARGLWQGVPSPRDGRTTTGLDGSVVADGARPESRRRIAIVQHEAIDARPVTDLPRVKTAVARRRRPSRGRRPVPRTASRPIRPRGTPGERATGELDIHVDPWAEVWVDGTKLPHTAPLRGLRLPAGPHRLRLVNPELGRQAVRQVTIPANGSIRVNVSLRR